MTSYIRESLTFEVGMKENLLKNIEVSLELARCQVDPLQVKKKNGGIVQKIPCTGLSQVGTSRLGLLHGPPGTGKTSLCRALANKVVTNSKMLSTMVTNVMQVAIQLTGEPGTFTQGILVDVNSQSLCSKVLNIFLLHPPDCPFAAVAGGEWQTGAEAV